MAVYVTMRVGLAMISGLLLVANCGESSRDDPAGAGGSQDGGGRSGAGGSRGGSGGGGNGGAGGTGVSGSSGAGGAVGKGGSGGATGSSGAGGAAGAGGSSGGATGGTGPIDGGGGVGGATDGGGVGGAGSGGTAGLDGGKGGSIDAGRDGVGGSAGSGGAGGSGKDGAADQSGGAGKAGSSGAGGGPADSGSATCPTALLGWATVSGDGVSATTGGGNASPVRPTTVAELTNYASDGSARIIEIAGTFTVPSLQVNSNKTLVGIGNNATINGGIRIRGDSGALVQNVIIKNLRINGLTTAVEDDAVQIYFAHHVWIDHCEIWDGPDGNLDMSHAANWVTVSWTKFRYTPSYQRPPGETSDHRFSNLLGHSDDNASEDDGRLKVTFHHNWWAERVLERMPRVRFGQVHVFNNYYASAGNDHCVRAGISSHLLVEGNYFDGVRSPHEFNSSADEMTASITARNNTYNATTGNQSTGGGGTPFTTVPYSATIEPAAGIPTSVRACAGPR